MLHRQQALNSPFQELVFLSIRQPWQHHCRRNKQTNSEVARLRLQFWSHHRKTRIQKNEGGQHKQENRCDSCSPAFAKRCTNEPKQHRQSGKDFYEAVPTKCKEDDAARPYRCYSRNDDLNAHPNDGNDLKSANRVQVSSFGQAVPELMPLLYARNCPISTVEEIDSGWRCLRSQRQQHRQSIEFAGAAILRVSPDIVTKRINWQRLNHNVAVPRS